MLLKLSGKKWQSLLLKVHGDCLRRLGSYLFEKEDSVYFIFGVEVEFYIRKVSGDKLYDDFIITERCRELVSSIGGASNDVLKKFDVFIGGVEPESGKNQFEVQVQPIDDPIRLCSVLKYFIERAEIHLKAHNLIIDVSTKPFLDQPASACHFHVSLYSEEGSRNLFTNTDSGNYSPYILQAIGGILHHLNSGLPLYTTEGDYIRFEVDEVFKANPTNLSWGVNNRTATVRIPRPINADPYSSRVEFRAPPAKCNYFGCLLFLVFSITDGITKGRDCGDSRVYGDAFASEGDKIPKIAKTLQNAMEFYNNSILQGFLEKHIDELNR